MKDGHCPECARRAKESKFFDWTPCEWSERHLKQIEAERAAAGSCLLVTALTLTAAVVTSALRISRSKN